MSQNLSWKIKSIENTLIIAVKCAGSSPVVRIWNNKFQTKQKVLETLAKSRKSGTLFFAICKIIFQIKRKKSKKFVMNFVMRYHEKRESLNLSDALCFASLVCKECLYIVFITWSVSHPPIANMSASGIPSSLIFDAK